MNTMRLKKILRVGTKLKIQKSILRKRKYYIVNYIVNQNNYESDRERGTSFDENEIENNTNDNDDDDDYDKTIKKKRNKEKSYKKIKATHQQPKKKKIVEKNP